MRRSDKRAAPNKQRWPRLGLQAAPLPPAVYREFVGMMFSMQWPVLGLGIIFATVAGLLAYDQRDPINAALAVAATVVTAARLFTIYAYRRAEPVADVRQLKRWESRYALGSYAFALLLALLNIRTVTFHEPLFHLIAVSLVFAFAAGNIARISVRPVICVTSVLLANVPTIAALAAHAFTSRAHPLHAELFAIEALLIAMITGLGLQTVVHLYRRAVVHLTAKYDMALLAKHDELTGLANRLLLRERFRESLAAVRGDGKLAVHFIDLDGFKAINDGHGHPAGDAVLQEVARRLESTVRAEDTVARLGGDEFVILQTDLDHDGEAEMLARRIIKKVSAPYVVDGVEMRISASVGIALTPEFGRELEALLGCADAALYRSKGRGKGRVHFCTREDARQAERAVA